MAATSTVQYMMGQTTENIAKHMDIQTYRVPLGVIAGICPFNFPVMMPLWIFPLALMTGNTVIMKPSTYTPRSMIFLAKLAKEAGIPDGALQIVHGTKNTVNYLCDSPEIKSISFVGSNAVGKQVYQRAYKNGKRIQANLGAKCHSLIMPDAHKEQTLKSILKGAFNMAGQKCMSISVAIFVEKAENWIPELVQLAKLLKIGSGIESDTQICPMISEEAKQRVSHIIQQGIDDGATCLLDGREFYFKSTTVGNYLGPTILSNITTSNRAYTNEIFGPVLCCIVVPTIEDGIHIINSNPYGNGTCIFTSSGILARKFQHEIKIGQIGINVTIPIPPPSYAFTGNGASFLGDLHMNGQEGVIFFTETKTIMLKWDGNQHNSHA